MWKRAGSGKSDTRFAGSDMIRCPSQRWGDFRSSCGQGSLMARRSVEFVSLLSVETLADPRKGAAPVWASPSGFPNECRSRPRQRLLVSNLHDRSFPILGKVLFPGFAMPLRPCSGHGGRNSHDVAVRGSGDLCVDRTPCGACVLAHGGCNRFGNSSDVEARIARRTDPRGRFGTTRPGFWTGESQRPSECSAGTRSCRPPGKKRDDDRRCPRQTAHGVRVERCPRFLRRSI